jgi:hypothetical protein
MPYGVKKTTDEKKTATNKQTKPNFSSSIRQHSTKQLNPERHHLSGLWPKMEKNNLKNKIKNKIK